MRCLMLPKIKFSFLCVNRGRWMKSLNTDRNRTGKDGQQTESPLMQENELHQGGLFIVSRQEPAKISIPARGFLHCPHNLGQFSFPDGTGLPFSGGRTRTGVDRNNGNDRGYNINFAAVHSAGFQLHIRDNIFAESPRPEVESLVFVVKFCTGDL